MITLGVSETALGQGHIGYVWDSTWARAHWECLRQHLGKGALGVSETALGQGRIGYVWDSTWARSHWECLRQHLGKGALGVSETALGQGCIGCVWDSTWARAHWECLRQHLGASETELGQGHITANSCRLFFQNGLTQETWGLCTVSIKLDKKIRLQTSKAAWSGGRVSDIAANTTMN